MKFHKLVKYKRYYVFYEPLFAFLNLLNRGFIKLLLYPKNQNEHDRAMFIFMLSAASYKPLKVPKPATDEFFLNLQEQLKIYKKLDILNFMK